MNLDEKSKYLHKEKGLTDRSSSPGNIYVFKNKRNSSKLYLSIINEELRNIVISFLDYRKDMGKTETPLQKFLENIEESLCGSIMLPITYESFNFSTFKSQYEYYKNYGIGKRQRIHLKNFYIFLMERLEEQNSKHKIFDIHSGMDKTFIHRVDFYKLYELGYKVVNLNKFDDLPTVDKWLLNPNGHEKNTTAIKTSQYMPLDFTRVKDEKMRNEIKEWFFYSNRSLKSLRNEVNSIFLFFEFLESEETNEILDNLMSFNIKRNKEKYNSLISEDSVILYRKYVNDKYNTELSRNTSISCIGVFLKHLNKKRVYNLNPRIFEYLKTKKAKQLSGKAINKEDLEKIASKLKDNMINGDVLDKLFWIFFHISLTTKFRTNEILDLRVTCIHESMKQGDNIIKMQTKTSSGLMIEENPTEYTVRVIKQAISLTEDLRREADDKIKSYIFIYKSRKGIIEPIKLDTFYRRFKKVTSSLNLKNGPYTVYNCRHTYMTNLFEQAMKEGNIEKALTASGHKDIATTMKHYVKPEIKLYLEALYKVKIGNVDINGEIIDSLEKTDVEIPEDIREITVKDGCGFCRGNCSINENIDCLICRNFVVTLDRIPFFEQSIEKINQVIKNEKILHEKEHLVSIKKLYVAYLASLHTFRLKKEKA